MVSVIIPVYNGEQTIRECLDALYNQLYPTDQYEIIVVDDASQDETIAIVKQYSNVRLIRQKRNGPASARNLGARNAKSKILLFTDADCIPQANWIREMISPFDDLSVVGVKGRYTNKQNEPTSRFIQREYEEKYSRMSVQTDIDFIDTYSAAYRRDIFFRFGGFDESFPTACAEDIEFSFRLAQAGMRMVFNPKAIVLHHFETSLWGYLKKKMKNGYWRFYVIRRFPRKLVADSHTPQIIKIQLMFFFLFLFSLGMAPFSKLASGLFYVSFPGYTICHLRSFIEIFQRDRSLIWMAPLFFFLRSTGLTLGLLGGLLVSLLSRVTVRRSTIQIRNNKFRA